jgi:hypothetical protein
MEGAHGLTPLTFAMVGLVFALYVNGTQLLGAFPEREGFALTGKSVAVAGSLMGAVTLLFDAIWFVTGSPFGSRGGAIAPQLVFGAIAGMYGLLWLAAGVAQLSGWDLRPIGQMCIACIVFQVFEIAVIATWRPFTATLAGIEVALFLFLPVLLGFYLLTHGRTQSQWVGWACMAAALGSFWLAFAPTGVAPFLPGSA